MECYVSALGVGGEPRLPLLLIPVLSSSHLLHWRERGDEIDLFQLLHLSSPRHNTSEGCSTVQQLYSVITASNGARGGEDRQGCQDHDGHPEGHGHPGLGPRCHPPDARVLLPVGLIISEGLKISFSKYGENCVGSFNNVFSQTAPPHHSPKLNIIL